MDNDLKIWINRQIIIGIEAERRLSNYYKKLRKEANEASCLIAETLSKLEK